MSHTARNLDQEFWRPPVHHTEIQEPRPATIEVCPRCQTEPIIGSRFCHVCGTEREAQPRFAKKVIRPAFDFRLVYASLGLNVAALVAFIAGIICVIGAVAVGFMYTATTLVDWQAVQTWRIEWLLAATVAFIAGILLKRTPA